MEWIVFSILTAIFGSLKDLASKRGLQRADEYLVTWASRAFSLPLLLPFQPLTGLPELGAAFFPTLGLIVLIQGIANILYFRALKVADLSLTIPLLAFTPLFLIGVSPIVVGETLGPWDILGILLITGGAYCLNFEDRRRSYWAPFRALLHTPGTRLMMIVSFLWSLLSTLNKVGIQNSSSVFWPIANSIVLALALTPVMLYKSQHKRKQLRENFPALVWVGLFQGLTLLCFMKAISLTLVARVVAVKRLSILFSVWIGYWCFQEAGIRQRTTAATIMLLGVFVIAIAA